MFITFEGLDFSGKSTQVKLLVDRLSHEDFNVIVLREPGGTDIGEKIRKLLLDKQTTGMTQVSEMLLFSASRSQLVEEVVRPALEGGMIVVCDRFVDSTTAYQGWGRGIPLDLVSAINRCATGGLSPDVTFFLDIPVAEVDRRVQRSRSRKDRMESGGIEFYEKVRAGYLDLAGKEARFRVVDGMHSVDDIQDCIWQEVGPRLTSAQRKTHNSA